MFKKFDSFNRTVRRTTNSCAKEPYEIENGDWYKKESCNFKQTYKHKCLTKVVFENL